VKKHPKVMSRTQYHVERLILWTHQRLARVAPKAQRRLSMWEATQRGRLLRRGLIAPRTLIMEADGWRIGWK